MDLIMISGKATEHHIKVFMLAYIVQREGHLIMYVKDVAIRLRTGAI